MATVNKTESDVINDAIGDHNFGRWLGYNLYPLLLKNIIRHTNGFSPQVKLADNTRVREFIIKVEYNSESGNAIHYRGRPGPDLGPSWTCSLLIVPQWRLYSVPSHMIFTEEGEIEVAHKYTFLDREIVQILNDGLPAFKTVKTGGKDNSTEGFVMVSVDRLLDICGRCRTGLNIAMVMSSISHEDDVEDNLWRELPINVVNRIAYYV
jgi:hypothetical protein